MDRSEALRELRENAGSQFDPRVARTLLEILGDDSPPPLGSPSETRDQTLSRELEELAAELGAEDLFVFRRVGGGLYAHLGGVGRGAGWAGNIELDSGDEHHLRAAVAGKTAIWVELESARRILGPYYGRSAAIVPCSPESVIVFGSATHSLTATGPERTAWLAQRAQRLVLEVSPAKRLADELEVLAAVRDVTTVSGDSMPETLKAIANRTRTALSAAYVAVATVAGAELDPAIGASAGAWQPADPGAAIRALARFAAHPSALPLLRQDVIQMPDAPAGFRHGDGVCSIYVLPIGSPAVAVLLVVHAGPGPRGFTEAGGRRCVGRRRTGGAPRDRAGAVARGKPPAATADFGHRTGWTDRVGSGRTDGPQDLRGTTERPLGSALSLPQAGREHRGPNLRRIADQAHIRNFSIIAHIDHGKSTLADRILELTHTIDPRSMRAQVLDSMDLERERGITIKAQAVRVFYRAGDGQAYQLHLIDTPGHVDFTYEVSRSLAACEGALLVVDASQGVEAQTVANTYLAVESGLELIPCLNKVDLPGAEPERVAEEVAELLGEPADGVRRISAKTGEGITDVLDELIARVPPPSGDPDGPPRALIFDSEFDQYRGVVAYIRVVDGTFTKGEAIRAMQAGTEAEIDDIGFFTPQMTPADALRAGEVGYLITGIKDVTKLRVGDTLTTLRSSATEPLPGYREVKPMVFCGLFPIDSDAYPELRDALEKLTLNDAALSWEPETSDALGFGFRCGFLGLLHMDIVRERLEREYDLELLATMPSVEYEVTLTDGTIVPVHSPNDMPEPTKVAEVREPYIRASILTPKEYVGQIMELCQERRGEHAGMHYLSSERLQITYDLPLAEIVLDFFDQLKSRTRGYASLDYDLIGLRESDLVKLDILLAGDPVDALSMLIHRSKAEEVGRTMAEKLRKKIPRQQYDVPIQAAIGSRIVARETIKAYRKDVIAKCYGGDISRKRKLLEQQKKGKQRMKQVGRIEVPQEAFLAVLELGEKAG